MITALWRRFLGWLLPGSVVSGAWPREGDWLLDDGDHLTGPRGVRWDIAADLDQEPPPTMTDIRNEGVR